MKHPGARAAQQVGRAFTANAVTAVVVVLIVSPFTDESGLEAQLQGPPPWRFCLNGSDSSDKPVCFTLDQAPKDYDGPPTDPEVFKAQQQKLQAELQRRAEEARRKLEQERKKLESDQPK